MSQDKMFLYGNETVRINRLINFIQDQSPVKLRMKNP